MHYRRDSDPPAAPLAWVHLGKTAGGGRHSLERLCRPVAVWRRSGKRTTRGCNAGGVASYMHEELDDVVDAVVPGLKVG